MAVVADVLVAKVVDMLISTIAREIELQVRLVIGVENEVEKLKNVLQSIQAVLIDAERRQLKEASVQLWLDRLQDVTYDIEDVFDEWSTEIFKSQIQIIENAHKPKRKVRSFNILSSCSCFPKVVLRHRIATEIDRLNTRLAQIADEKGKYSFNPVTIVYNEQVERSITTSIIDISEVKGRETDKEDLLKLLLSESSQMPKPRLIPIVGMGGIGKTTLAKLIYNDERVKSFFDKRIWICVSDPFDESIITREILESLEGVTPNLVALPKMMEKLQESVVGKKILFVLDDVWNEERHKWKQLEDCLKSSEDGSCILVTTRNVNVGKIMGCLESDIFRVGLLSEDESWELFCMIAFSTSRKSTEERASLENIGRKVVSRCKGLPLAVRTIAGLLQFKESRREWENVSESELWNLEEVHSDFIAPLWLSYYNLPSPLKQCFSYCAIFPKDHDMEKGELVKLWMAQGYIKETRSKDMETIGYENFQNLVMRSLFQDVEVRSAFGVAQTWFKMHDLVHDFAQSLVKKECLGVEAKVGESITLDDSFGNSLRHLSVNFRLGIRCLDSFYSLKKLRTLHISTPMIDHQLSIELDLEKLFNELTSLRSLRLYCCYIAEIPSSINKLIHLRELDLSRNYYLRELPHTIWELYNLQTLILNSCQKMRSLEGLGSLTNLRHIENFDTHFVFPKEMMKLSGLRRLSDVKVDLDNEEAISLKHLKNLNQLGGSLEITWLKRSDGDVEDAEQSEMKDKKHIIDLCLWLYHEETEGRTKHDEDLLEALNAPPNLETLQIEHYMGLEPPSWMAFLTSVKMIRLNLWKIREHLPALGKLPCLEGLHLERFYRVKKVGAEFLGLDEMILSSSSNVRMFPKLRTLSFEHLDNWEEWDDIDGGEEISIMPNLTSLKLWFCKKLKTLPNFILQKTGLKLEIKYCGSLGESTS